MSDDGWSLHDLTEMESIAAQAYVDGIRFGATHQAAKESKEIDALESRIGELEDKFGVSDGE